MSGPVVLLAPDKFKGTLTAVDVCHSLSAGISAVTADAEIRSLPVADGGDGTLASALTAGYERVPVTVSGPTGEAVRTAFARAGTTAVVEMADACGLDRLPHGVADPLGADSRGLGQVMAAALDAGCTELVIGIGGSASTDGGAGLLRALGAVVLTGSGEPVPSGGGGLEDVTSLDLTGLHPRLACTSVVVACDVDNPLLGEHGAAAVYGPQKGATPEQVTTLDAGLARWADVVAAAVGEDRRRHPGAGAAGGVGFALVAALGATLRPGIELMLEMLGFDEAVTGADLVVTGEGSLDRQSLRGKAPIGVAEAAAAYGVPVLAVCGRRDLSDDDLRAAGIGAAYALGDLEPDQQRCLAEPGPLLERLGSRIASDRLLGRD